MWNIVKIIKKGEYLYCITNPIHPNSTKNNYVLLHRVLMENHLGQILQCDEVVHHINGNKKDNRIQNLEVMPAKKHNQLHGFEQGKTLVDLICPQCGKEFTKSKKNTHLSKPIQAKTFCSRSCSGKFNREFQLRGLTLRMENAISVNVVRIYNSR